tara:strand:- start:198 stop:467 length:270 start_codon:yes stop_codon:yes gene_type:complete
MSELLSINEIEQVFNLKVRMDDNGSFYKCSDIQRELGRANQKLSLLMECVNKISNDTCEFNPWTVVPTEASKIANECIKRLKELNNERI